MKSLKNEVCHEPRNFTNQEIGRKVSYEVFYDIVYDRLFRVVTVSLDEAGWSRTYWQVFWGEIQGSGGNL